jgi:class 3 adenylate cyclase/tetratricopeptide (TPR) repeat protein
MDYEAVRAQVLALLQQEQRLSYRVLKRQLQLDDDTLEDLKEDLIYAKKLAVDEDGRVLVWVGASGTPSGEPDAVAPERAGAASRPIREDTAALPPISYTPRHLAERILAEQQALAARGAPDGERKTITALFADIKGSMALLEDLDPEEARHIIDPALRLMMEAVHRYEGYVAQSLGDGIFALFGAPIAHEDHAQRALYAALRMQEAIAQYSQRLRGERGVNLEIRVGVNTGEVVLRAIRTDDLHTDYVPIGHATSLATRLQSLATGGAIVVSAPTYRLTEGYFTYASLGSAQVKGVSEPVPLYQVVGVGPLRTRLEVSARRGLVRFVGRQGELTQLRKALEQARGGRGQIVGVVGEPGVGKSRLYYEFKLRAPHGGLVLETFSVSHGKAYPYLPLLELLKHYFQLTTQDEARRRREQVTGKLLTLDRSLEDTLPYLLALLGDGEATAQLAQMDPPLRRRRTFEAITRVLLRESLHQPLLLLIEDLHWLDSETEAWLQLLSERVPTAPILLLVNYRPEYQHAWGSRTYYTQLRLDALGREEADELLTALLGADVGAPHAAPLQALKQLILARTEGNPFFMEELVQALVEQGIVRRERTVEGQVTRVSLTRPLTAIQLPPTVQGILAARMDRLSADDKALLQILAVIGKEFPLSLLTQVVCQPEAEVQGGLAHLQQGEFIYEQPAFPEPEYTFKHALTQEVAYQSLLLERRRELHERTAQAIEVLSHGRLEERYNELAHHYSRSSNAEKAVVYLQAAGEQASQRSALGDAIAHLTTALARLNTLPDTPQRLQQELHLHLSLGVPLVFTKGHAAPEVEATYTRALALCQQVGDASQHFAALLGLRRLHYGRGDLQQAQGLSEELLALAQQADDAEHLARAQMMLAEVLLSEGVFAQARDHAAQGSALYDRQRQRDQAILYGNDAGVGCLSYEAIALWMLGYPDQALQRSQQGQILAQEVAHPFSLAFALRCAGWVHQYRREAQTAQARAEAVMVIATDHGFPLWPMRQSCGAGRSPRRASWRRASPRCSRVWPLYRQ